VGITFRSAPVKLAAALLSLALVAAPSAFPAAALANGGGQHQSQHQGRKHQKDHKGHERKGDFILASAVTGTSPADGATVVRPDAPVVFTLALSGKDTRERVLGHGDDGRGRGIAIGVYLAPASGAGPAYLATAADGGITVSGSGASVTVTATHPLLARYTTYDAYLLTGSALHQLLSQDRSDGHSRSFGV